VAHDGEVATRLGLPPVPACAEVIDLERILLLMRETGARVHVCRVSHAETLRRIAAARAEGLPVTCDVSIHHLHLCEIDLGFFDSNCRLNPPLRSLRDRDALREALASGVVDAVCSDHTPVDDDAKQLPFAEAAPGATGLELLLPLTLKWAKEAGVPLAQALARLTRDPARILGIDAGTLRPGAVADVCIFDPEAAWVVEPGALHSQGRNTPFLGLALSGRTRYTLVAGNVVYAS
jgi:dihydroorotase